MTIFAPVALRQECPVCSQGLQTPGIRYAGTL